MKSKFLSKNRSCRGKRPFANEKLAKWAMMSLVDHLRATNQPVPFFSAYQCKHCGGWHYGRSGGMTRPQMVVSLIDSALAADAALRERARAYA